MAIFIVNGIGSFHFPGLSTDSVVGRILSRIPVIFYAAKHHCVFEFKQQKSPAIDSGGRSGDKVFVPSWGDSGLVAISAVMQFIVKEAQC